jgi:hypothetical protein
VCILDTFFSHAKRIHLSIIVIFFFAIGVFSLQGPLAPVQSRGLNQGAATLLLGAVVATIFYPFNKPRRHHLYSYLTFTRPPTPHSTSNCSSNPSNLPLFFYFPTSSVFRQSLFPALDTRTDPKTFFLTSPDPRVAVNSSLVHQPHPDSAPSFPCACEPHSSGQSAIPAYIDCPTLADETQPSHPSHLDHWTLKREVSA